MRLYARPDNTSRGGGVGRRNLNCKPVNLTFTAQDNACAPGTRARVCVCDRRIARERAAFFPSRINFSRFLTRDFEPWESRVLINTRAVKQSRASLRSGFMQVYDSRDQIS